MNPLLYPLSYAAAEREGQQSASKPLANLAQSPRSCNAFPRLSEWLRRLLRRSIAGGPGAGEIPRAPWLLAASGIARRASRLSLDFLSPGFCRECGVVLPYGPIAFCDACLGHVEWIASACARCAMPLANPPQRLADDARYPACAECFPLGPHFDLAAAGGRYAWALRSAILRFKFRRDISVLPLLETALVRAASASWIADGVREADALVPVPLHPLKRWWRAWDPVDELTRRVAGCLVDGRTIPVRRLLRKRRWTRVQIGLVRKDRLQNLRGAFAAWSPGGPPRVVVLVDDVLTTGATASECAKALKSCGVCQVLVLAVARSAGRSTCPVAQ